MAVVTGNDYDHIDIVNGSTQTRHMIKDASARADIADLKSALTLIDHRTTEGKYIALNGTLVDNANFKVTELVPCFGAETALYIGNSSNANIFVIAFYKKDKSYLPGSGTNQTGDSGTLLSVTVPTGAYYARVCAQKNQKIELAFTPSESCVLGEQLYSTQDQLDELEDQTAQDINELNDTIMETIGAEKGIKARSVDAFVKTWNLWDGSWGVSQKNPVTNSSVSYLVCSPSIPVTSGSKYSVGIVSNPLSNKVNVLSLRFYDTNGDTVGNSIALYRLGGYLKWIEVPSGATQAVVMFNTNDASIPITPEELIQAGFKVVFAERLVNFTNRDSAGQYAFSADEWIPSYLLRKESIEKVVTHIVTVGSTNSNFTSLRNALDDILEYGEPGEYNRFEVQIKEGIYDISSYYTSTEKAASNFMGLIIPDWVTLKGIGNREKTVLQYILDSNSSHICVLNLQNTCNLENLTLYGVHTRYCVHDDKANESGIPYTRYCKNVHFKGNSMAYGAVYGAGIKSNSEWTFENCIFESLTESSYQNCFSVHGSQIAQVGTNYVHFINCRFIGHGATNNALILSTLKNNAGQYQNYCDLAGCSANGRLILREEDATQYGKGIAWWATGYATTFTDKLVNNTDQEDYTANIDII